jgi:hypothetical protein
VWLLSVSVTTAESDPLVTGVPPSSDQLMAYRDAVARLVVGLDGPLLRRRAAVEPDLLAVLDALPGGAEDVLARLEVEALAFRPGPRSNVRTPAEHVRLLLLQQIDVLWWSVGRGPRPFADDAAVLASRDLVPLAGLRAGGTLGFHYLVSPRSLPARARNYAVRRWAPDREPHSSGLSYDRARPAVVALLDDVARRFAAAVPRWQHGLWVNCLVRSEAVQDHLRDLGYSAATSSSHCAGYAADVEMAWLDRHGRAAPLQEILLGLRDAGTINLIDEGQAWHVCLSPVWVSSYEQAFTREHACAG